VATTFHCHYKRIESCETKFSLAAIMFLLHFRNLWKMSSTT